MDEIMSFLERMRQKSPEVKGRYAFVIALSVTGVIAIIWAFSLPARFAELSKGTSAEEPEVTEESGGGFVDLVNETRSQLGTVFEGVDTETVETAPLEDANVDTPKESSPSNITFIDPEAGEVDEKEQKGRVVLIATSSSETAKNDEQN